MELLRALGVLVEPPAEEHARIAELVGLPTPPEPSAYYDLFLLQAYPFASVYLGAEGMMGGEACDRVAGFWRALHLTPPPEPDHLCALLALYVSLTEREETEEDEASRALVSRACDTLLYEHLASWVFLFLSKVGDLGGSFYSEWGALLETALFAEMRSRPRPEELPLHLREAPDLPDPRSVGGEAFLKGLVAPARSGIIVTRADLAVAARQMDLGLRIGERLFVLKALFSQDAGRVLEWIVGTSDDWAARHQARAEDLGDIAVFWESRARTTAHLARSLLDGRSDWDVLPDDGATSVGAEMSTGPGRRVDS